MAIVGLCSGLHLLQKKHLWWWWAFPSFVIVSIENAVRSYSSRKWSSIVYDISNRGRLARFTLPGTNFFWLRNLIKQLLVIPKLKVPLWSDGRCFTRQFSIAGFRVYGCVEHCFFFFGSLHNTFRHYETLRNTSCWRKISGLHHLDSSNTLSEVCAVFSNITLKFYGVITGNISRLYHFGDPLSFFHQCQR